MTSARNLQVRIAATAAASSMREDLHARNVRILHDHEADGIMTAAGLA